MRKLFGATIEKSLIVYGGLNRINWVDDYFNHLGDLVYNNLLKQLLEIANVVFKVEKPEIGNLREFLKEFLKE